jgi:hypothetical protein
MDKTAADWAQTEAEGEGGDQIQTPHQALVAHTCNPSYSGLQFEASLGK